ncbi:MAG: phosphatidylinositol-specific phospholipase C1-like protein [Pseudomonadales bacterium]|nr:phosphatidylinositol-specific phospholipase C1-like protein [Pseudomonadales bacterium]MDG1441198.1 phosphatidylinositol-specific phospholipase C1-like protein [Pseudomonadales bacterium]
MIRLVTLFCTMLFTLSLLASCTSTTANPAFNQLQFIGSHNSYKQAIDPELLEQLAESNSALAASLDYTHLPLNQQLDLGLRKLELDVLDDPAGGLYQTPLGLRIIAAPSVYSSEPMLTPGFKVLHVQDIDFRSHCQLFSECLASLDAWSDTHPEHFPIVVTINAKDDPIKRPGFVQPLLFNADSWNRLDQVIKSTLGQKLYTPDDLRGSQSSLYAAIKKGWPALNTLRGKFIFVLDHTGAKLETYIEGHEALRNRAMFVNAMEGTPEAAIRIINDPVEQFDYIQTLVSQGYIVRTRADADTVEARTGNTKRRSAAFRSGAQIISTDYYQEKNQFGSDYKVMFSEGIIARCNPVTSIIDCEFSN